MDDNDSVDRHIEQWSTEIPDLDMVVEGAITRMQMLVKHLRHQKLARIDAYGLGYYEYETLHMLGGCGPDHRATPKQIANWLQMSPAAITGRLDMLEQRGFVRRSPSPDDGRSVIVSLTRSGLKTWRAACRDQRVDEERLLAPLTPQERTSLATLLRVVFRVIDRPDLLTMPGDATS